MPLTITFHFNGILNDFLTSSQKNNRIYATYKHATSVKDAIESLGVPHPEIGTIFVNDAAVDLSYLINHEDNIEVYPRVLKLPEIGTDDKLNNPITFIVDVHLGSLARAMRMLGFDVLYENKMQEKDLAQIAAASERTVLTRSVNLLKHKQIQHGYWLRKEGLESQLEEIINRYQLRGQIKPFTRCLVCNGVIIPVTKESVIEKIPPKTKRFFQEFYECIQCKKVYWKGSHYGRMMTRISKFLNRPPE